LASQKNVETGSSVETVSRDQSEKIANKIILSEKIISEAEKQSTSTSEINLENKFLLDSLMSDAADEFISQLDSLHVADLLTADACTVVCSQPSADLPSLPTPLTGSLGPGPSHDLHTGMSAPTATATVTAAPQPAHPACTYCWSISTGCTLNCYYWPDASTAYTFSVQSALSACVHSVFTLSVIIYVNCCYTVASHSASSAIRASFCC